ncbi:unnamed protein product [Darwinula stevensoni]|uniref:Carbohydrate sulfotransferase n=1 Tax=Darwinula stevensoni TaxID=69355 RepID=A0A7R8XE44_9CRUS|nr:unnamed protein product [Darwinula stevensoni]CAG0889211.1 unnamed protein product [Darwinula stevensoni]
MQTSAEQKPQNRFEGMRHSWTLLVFGGLEYSASTGSTRLRTIGRRFRRVKGKTQRLFAVFMFLRLHEHIERESRRYGEQIEERREDRLEIRPRQLSACTLLLWLLLRLYGSEREERLPWLHVVIPGENGSVLLRDLEEDLPREGGWKKAIMVRDPFVRLVASYRDLIEDNLGLAQSKLFDLSRDIVSRFRNVTSTKDSLVNPWPESDVATWREFARYLAETPATDYDEHFSPYWLHCDACGEEFHYVLKTESLRSDFLGLFKDTEANLNEDVETLTMAVLSRPEFLVSTLDIVPDYMMDLTKTQLRQVYEKFRLDFQLFEYSPDEYINYGRNP